MKNRTIRVASNKRSRLNKTGQRRRGTKKPAEPPPPRLSMTNAHEMRPNIMSLPRELHLMILSYLSSYDLLTLRRVSVYFEEITCDPALWKDYEVIGNEIDTSTIIDDLKRMPFLTRICIRNRYDCDDILRQIPLSNKNLEQLYVINCTGSTSGLHLRAGHLTRIAKRCRRLHTVQLVNTRFRGLKLFKMLGDAGPRLRQLVATTTTRAQFRAFANNARHVGEMDRKILTNLPRSDRRLASLRYRLVNETIGRPAKIFITYRDDPCSFVSLELQAVCENEKEADRRLDNVRGTLRRGFAR